MYSGIFLDRDGTINKEVEYLSSPEELVLIPGSAAAIGRVNKLGYKVVVLTNQSAIARGLLSEDDLKKIHARLDDLLASEGARIDAYYYCPHHPDAVDLRYRVSCDCRKPLPGMLKRAALELQIDPSTSFVIGDRIIDLQMGNAVGAYSILVRTGYGMIDQSNIQKNDVRADYVAENLQEAIRHIIETDSLDASKN